MAAGAGVTLDTIVINIESNASKANTSIENLSETLGALKDAIKGGFNNLNKLATGLKALSDASEGIPNAVKDLSAINEITKTLNDLSKIPKPTGLKNAVENLEKIPTTFAQFDPKVVANIARVSRELSDALSPLATKLSAIGQGLTSLSMLAKNYGIAITKVGNDTKRAGAQISQFGKSASTLDKAFKFLVSGVVGVNKLGSNAFGKLNSKIKQVALSLLGTRTLFTAIRKAISEYMAMDVQLTKATQNLWRALGAQLAPAVEYVLYLFKQIVRVIYSVVYALTGIDLIARANAKAMDAWGKSSAKTLGNLQKFDDLNVVDFGSGTGEETKIELEKIDLSPIQKVIDWMKRLKEAIIQAWHDGGWNQVAVVLAEGVNDAFGALTPEDWGRVIGNGILTGLSFIKTFITTTEWGDIGQKIGDTIRNMPWGQIWNEIVAIAKGAFNGFDAFIDGLFGSESAGELATAIGGILIGLKAINKFKTTNIFSGLVSGASQAIFAITDLANKITNIQNLSKSTKAMSILSPETVQQLTGIGPTLQSSAIPALGKFFGFFTGGSLGATAGIIAAVVIGVMALVTAFKNLYENSEPFRETVDALIASLKDYLIGLMANLKEMLMVLWDVLVVIWEQVLVPLFDLLVSIIEPFLEALIEIVFVLWENAIKPLAEGLMNILKPAFMVVMDVVKALMVVIGAVIDVIQWLWTYLLEPIVSFLLDIVVGAIKMIGVAVEIYIGMIVGYWEFLIGCLEIGWKLLKAGFLAVYNYVKEKFIDPLVKAWESIVEGWDKMWTGVKSGAKSAINWVLEKVESFINRMIRGINSLSSGLRKIGNKIFDIIGVDVTFEPISEVSLPRLETGTNEIPYEGIYHLHPGEAVVPKKYNPALGNGGNNEEMNQKLDTLIGIMNNMSFTNVVNVGNETLYKKQQKYNKTQNDKYGTTVNL